MIRRNFMQLLSGLSLFRMAQPEVPYKTPSISLPDGIEIEISYESARKSLVRQGARYLGFPASWTLCVKRLFTEFGETTYSWECIGCNDSIFEITPSLAYSLTQDALAVYGKNFPVNLIPTVEYKNNKIKLNSIYMA